MYYSKFFCILMYNHVNTMYQTTSLFFNLFTAATMTPFTLLTYFHVFEFCLNRKHFLM